MSKKYTCSMPVSGTFSVWPSEKSLAKNDHRSNLFVAKARTKFVTKYVYRLKVDFRNILS